MKQGRVVFFGSTMSGKTSLINLYFNKKNPLGNQGTIGMDLQKIKIFGKVDCEFLIVDTNGHQTAQMTNNIFIKVSKGPLKVIICFDLHSANGGEDIQYYIDQVKSNNENAKIIILGTKQNLGEHENFKNIDKQFPDYPFYKVGLNSKELLDQIFHQFYEEIQAQQTLIQQELQIDQDRKSQLTLIQQELQIDQDRKFIQNKQEQSLIKKQKKQSFWGLCACEFDD